MKIIGANVTGSFILNGVDVTNTLQSSSIWSGSVASSINSLNAATASINTSITSLNSATASLYTATSSLNSATSSINSSITSLNAATASLYTATASLDATITTLTTTASFNSYTSSNDSAVLSATMAAVAAAASAAALTAKTSSYATTSSLNAATASLNTFTASAATTGSNTFFGTQTITGSLFISQNLVVQGSSSIQNITASAVSIGTNTVILNTDSPAVRFGGIKVQDSGSGAGASGSLLWDSLEDRWLYVTPSGSSEGYNSAILISGPKNSGSVGSEVGLTTNKIAKAVGDDHIGDSIMTESGTVISVAGSLSATSLTGSINGSQLTDATVSNAKLANSTISGISLGSNLATLTIGTGLSGTSYNGSTAVTIANTGVTSNVAGTGISVSGATGAVTITNSGVTSIVAGTGVTVSGATGAVTISIGQSIATSATPTFGKVFLTTNLATGIANNSFNTSKAILGNIHMQNGDGSSGDNKQAAITFQGGSSSEAQAGIYVSNNNSTGTAMGFATTDSYATGPQLFLTATNAGQVTFPRALVQVNGYLRTAGVTSNTVLFSGGTNSVDFGNALGQGTSSRSTYFRGNTNNVSVWWGGIDGNGSNIPYAAIDAVAGEFNFWRNSGGTGGGTWTNIMTMNSSGLTINSGNFIGNLTGNVYGARFQFDSYGNWTPGGAGGAAIVNSNEGQYQALMIVGNSSAGGVRVVKVWDNLQVQGAMSATGDVTAYFSDGRLKENLQPLKNAISKITTLTGYTYNTNALGKKLLNNEDVSNNKVGLIAQDLQKVLPEAVKLAPFDNDGKNNSKSGENYLTIQYEKIVPLLIEAIKEQQTQIEELKTIINGLTK